MSSMCVDLPQIVFDFNDTYRLRNVLFLKIITVVETDVSRFSMTADFVFRLWLVHKCSCSIAKNDPWLVSLID
jgi:hypothetical protein